MNYGMGLLDALAEKFGVFPGISEKTAWKMVFHVLKMPKDIATNLANDIIQVSEKMKKCQVCRCFTETEICHICCDETRDKSMVCVIQNMKDMFAFERMGYKGVYHVLDGLLSPMNGIGPEDIGICELLARVENSVISEIIMAIGPTVEGDATTNYIFSLLKPLGITVTRLAYGLPVGSSLEYTDDVTLNAALEGRNEI
ncbi:MAG: recombination mediator RecR [Oscillospiraceae bacterium]|jgi:recombination protein RecR|nr:recombination mediator RecR [Oscillospiraceae bacterium]